MQSHQHASSSSSSGGSSTSCRDRQTSTTEDAFHDLVNNHKAQSSAYVKRAMLRETDAQTLFGTMGDSEFRKSKRALLEHLTGGASDFAYAEAGFRNAKPQYQSSFIVHPEWVSEQVARQGAGAGGALRASTSDKK